MLIRVVAGWDLIMQDTGLLAMGELRGPMVATCIHSYRAERIVLAAIQQRRVI